jgi:Ca2+-binding RTX toxin-like protein
MKGGGDDDIYYVDSMGDQILEDATHLGGMDKVYTSASHALSAYVEQLYASGSASISLTGNDLTNTITGNAGRNLISGNAGDDTLYGEAGNDILKGNAGDDKLWGGSGKDTLTGSTGKDTFVFNTKLNKKTNLDKITDYKVKDDTIWLDNKVMSKLGKKGTELKPAKINKKFFSLDKAKDGNDYLIYVKKSGKLLYDADGSGSKAAIEIATLSKKLKMAATEFFVI